MLNKYIFLIFCLFVGVVAVAQGIPPPDGLECCDLLLEQTGDLDLYTRCRDSSNPNAFCSAALPIDDSVYILLAGVSGVVLAFFVIHKKVKYKKTPM
nr:hypothetical protein [uncultured Flavobacterium sp.]